MEQRTPDGKRTKQRLLEQAAQTLVAALLLGSASGCATMDYGDRYDRPSSYSRASSRVRILQVLPGDTVEDVARRFNVSEQAIIDANDLHPPYRFRRSQSIVLPASPRDGSSTTHVVASGETINSIARSYGVSPWAIV